MRFSTAAFLALAAAVSAQTTPDFDSVFAPKSQEVIPAGSTYLVQWSPNAKYTGKITITLIGGKDQDHQVAISTLSSTVDNSANQYSWSVASNLGDAAVYGLSFTLNSNASVLQYSNPFHISTSSGGGNSTSSGSSSASSTSTSTTTTGSVSTSVTLVTVSPTPSGNYSMSTGPSKTTVTTTGSKTSTGTGSAATNTGGAAAVGAGSLALVGGLAMAVLAF